MLATFYAMKVAANEEQKSRIMKILNILYGTNATNETGGIDNSIGVEAEILNKLEKRWLEDEMKALKLQRQTVDDAVQLLANSSDSETIRMALNSSSDQENLTRRNLTRAELDTDLAELSKSLKGMPEDRPIHIKKIHIKVKEQNGLQANLGAGVDFSNEMPHSLHNNNNAKSETGSVWRFNGAYDNNARSTDGDVLRANGAFDNNAMSRNGMLEQT
eukprot:CAMPEP_0197681958 /NCGR_PEP_ID=MMETSP1338-20131121/95750_1 /TAXON_ID=43686 ORGANISM="Pelagodinium beii, Strain RCC1491" /NCGR_SAMPLE_ID=MMETSP1338 /ASSEMBLY_ACC=CAM_ASM_000754 /LENGTH=216 /DNA_ID=CAMNT_0043263371 /DNA_START=8 /DNA_END=658 /DNA_ORIENTATION=+